MTERVRQRCSLGGGTEARTTLSNRGRRARVAFIVALDVALDLTALRRRVCRVEFSGVQGGGVAGVRARQRFAGWQQVGSRQARPPIHGTRCARSRSGQGIFRKAAWGQRAASGSLPSAWS